MNEILARQLALDYSCDVKDILDEKNHFLLDERREGRRRFQERNMTCLKAAVVNGKVLFSGMESVVSWCRERYQETEGAWFLEVNRLRELDERLSREGYRVECAHPFYIAQEPSFVDSGDYEIRWYEGKEIDAFRGDVRFGESYAFDADAPDVLGVSASLQGEILGMAGASCDSPYMWQIGIDVLPAARGRGIGSMLVAKLKNEILNRGILPFYGTSQSHIASQRVALRAGFVPAWAELMSSLSPS